MPGPQRARVLGPRAVAALLGALVWSRRPAQLTLLDLGCGDGALGRLLAPHLPGARYHGFDLDEARLERARGTPPSPLRARFHALDLADLAHEGPRLAPPWRRWRTHLMGMAVLGHQRDPAHLLAGLCHSFAAGPALRLVFLEHDHERRLQTRHDPEGDAVDGYREARLALFSAVRRGSLALGAGDPALGGRLAQVLAEAGAHRIESAPLPEHLPSGPVAPDSPEAVRLRSRFSMASLADRRLDEEALASRGGLEAAVIQEAFALEEAANERRLAALQRGVLEFPDPAGLTLVSAWWGPED